jgi:Protein kinase domain
MSGSSRRRQYHQYDDQSRPHAVDRQHHQQDSYARYREPQQQQQQQQQSAHAYIPPRQVYGNQDDFQPRRSRRRQRAESPRHADRRPHEDSYQHNGYHPSNGYTDLRQQKYDPHASSRSDRVRGSRSYNGYHLQVRERSRSRGEYSRHQQHQYQQQQQQQHHHQYSYDQQQHYSRRQRGSRDRRSSRNSSGGQSGSDDRCSSDNTNNKHKHNGDDAKNDDEGHFQGKPGALLKGSTYELIQDVGTGTFGRVVECWDRQHRRYVAVKIVRKVRRYYDSALVEADILRDVNSKGDRGVSLCVELLDQFNMEGHCCLVFERMGSSLYDLLKRNDYAGFPLQVVRHFAYDLLNAVAFLHSMKLIHTDLKPENVLLCDTQPLQTKATHSGKQQIVWPRSLRTKGMLLFTLKVF